MARMTRKSEPRELDGGRPAIASVKHLTTGRHEGNREV